MSNVFAKKVISLQNALTVQPHAIVSQTVAENGDTSLTLFAFDQGQNIASHSAPVDAVVLVTQGEAQITVSGQKFTLHAGEMLLMPKGEPHSLLALSAFKMALFKI